LWRKEGIPHGQKRKPPTKKPGKQKKPPTTKKNPGSKKKLTAPGKFLQSVTAVPVVASLVKEGRASLMEGGAGPVRGVNVQAVKGQGIA
jgi:hypothetical protein